jgi:hypothetical protein
LKDEAISTPRLALRERAFTIELQDLTMATLPSNVNIFAANKSLGQRLFAFVRNHSTGNPTNPVPVVRGPL